MNPYISKQICNLARFISFPDFYSTDRYRRSEGLTVLRGASATVRAVCTDINKGGLRIPFLPGVHLLMIDGVERARLDVAEGNKGVIDFALPTDELADETWVTMQVTGASGDGHIWYGFVKKTGGPVQNQQSKIPIVADSYNLVHNNATHLYGKIPAIGAPAAMPIAPREAECFSEVLPRAKLHRTNLVPPSKVGIYRKAVTDEGIVCTTNTQAYFWSHLVAKYPVVPLLDGPRNVGNITFPTHITPSRRGGAVVLEPHRLVRVSPDGYVQTICGWVHDDPPPYWGEAKTARLRLVGDWSAIPKERHGLHEAWAFVWDRRTLGVDESVPAIGPPDNLSGFEQPHKGKGPVGYIADTQNDRILKLQFPAGTHNPPVVTEHITGIKDPWGMEYWRAKLIVAERLGRGIVQFDADSGRFERVVLPNNMAGIKITASRMYQGKPKTAEALADFRGRYDCVMPEGLAIEDDESTRLVFGMQSINEIRAVDLVSGAVEKNLGRPKTGDGAHFINPAVSDGTFYPRETIFAVTWGNWAFGFPEVFLPERDAAGNPKKFELAVNGDRASGVGGAWTTLGYGSAVGVGRAANGDLGGRLYCGSSEEGLILLTKARADDPVIDSKRYTRGRNLWKAEGWDITHGVDGFGKHGLPLPWGDADMDYYLSCEGHRPGGETGQPDTPVQPPKDEPPVVEPPKEVDPLPIDPRPPAPAPDETAEAKLTRVRRGLVDLLASF